MLFPPAALSATGRMTRKAFWGTIETAWERVALVNAAQVAKAAKAAHVMNAGAAHLPVSDAPILAVADAPGVQEPVTAFLTGTIHDSTADMSAPTAFSHLHLTALRTSLADRNIPLNERLRATRTLKEQTPLLAEELGHMLRSLPRSVVHEWDTQLCALIERLNCGNYRSALSISSPYYHISHSDFLHARCFVVALGNQYFNAFLQGPTVRHPGPAPDARQLLRVAENILYPHEDEVREVEGEEKKEDE
jgi:hypothetical protein